MSNGLTRVDHLPLPRARAFTLVEVIIVIALATVLAGLLMPVLSRVNASARAATCASNLRQMTIAAQQYSATYDAWPTAMRYEQRQGQFVQVAWDWVTGGDDLALEPGPLWSFSDDPGRVQQCPEYPGSTNFGGDPFTGFNYNTTYIGGEAPFPSTGWDAVRFGVRPHACRCASACAMFGDGGRAGGTNKFMRAPLNEEGLPLSATYSGGQAFRHLGATNVAHVDGHVAAKGAPHQGDLATESLLEMSMDYPNNGFLSDDDRAYDPR